MYVMLCCYVLTPHFPPQTPVPGISSESITTLSRMKQLIKTIEYVYLYTRVNDGCVVFRLPGCVKLPSLPEGKITTIEIHRSNPYVELGISIVGGNETPLINVVIQEVYRDGVIARDGRLLAGDQILQVWRASRTSLKEALCNALRVSRSV